MTVSRSSRFLPFTYVFLTLSIAFFFGRSAAAAGREFYVSPAAGDASCGKESVPFVTIARARVAVRELRLAENPVRPVNV